MNKFLSIVLFPFFWISMYLYRIIGFDIIRTFINMFLMLFVKPLGPLGSLWLLITLPFVLIIDIPVGLFVTLATSITMSKQIFTGELDLATAMKEGFSKNHR